jgi:hypothetical protein
MVRRLFHLALLFALLCTHPACSSLRKRKSKRPAAMAAQPILTGVIALVNEEARFVLIDNGVLPVPSTGARMKSYAGGTETAELIATDVRRRPFTIADIRSGAPRKGDRVFVLPADQPAITAAPAQEASHGGAAASSLLREPPQLSPPAAADDQ